MRNVPKSILSVVGGLLVATLALACQSPSGPEPAVPSQPREEFGREAPEDPGLGSRAESSAGMEDISGQFKTIYFAFDKSELQAGAKDGLRHNARLLAQNPDARVEIQGNCDERGTDEYNLALGKRRAEAARRYLIDLGIDPGRLSTISFGEENPAVRGSTEEAWAKNRRDDFRLR